MALDQPPASGEIAVIWRQTPEHVQVIREYNRSIDLGRMPNHDSAKSQADQGDSTFIGDNEPALESDLGEEERSAWSGDATVFHVGIITKSWVALHSTQSTDCPTARVRYNQATTKRKASGLGFQFVRLYFLGFQANMT
jgi:hypothetical protein